MEETMRSTACWLLMILLFSASQPASLQSQQRPVSSSFNQSNATQSTLTQSAGQSAGQPEEPPFEVPTGTRFLVALQKEMNTKSAKAGERFVTRTLEPLTAPDGTLIPR